MNNDQKAKIYDECIRESDHLQRENSRIKSQHAGNIPPQLQEVINKNDKRISELVKVLEGLFM
jgi:hypothetical protein